MDGIKFFYQGSGIKILGKMGLRDQNKGKKIGINGSRIYHVTTVSQRPHVIGGESPYQKFRAKKDVVYYLPKISHI